MLLFLAVVALGVTLETVRPYWLKMILDNAGKGNRSQTLLYFGLFGVSIVIANWINSLGYFLGDRVVIPFSREIRETIFQKVMELDFAYHVDKNTGSLISAFRRGDGSVFSIFDSIHHELFRVLVSLTVTLYFLFNASAEMAWLLLLLFVVNLFIIWWLITINLKTRQEFNDSEDDVAGVIADSMINYETVKFFAAENKERQRLSAKFDIWSDKFWRFSNSFRLMDVVISSTAGGGMLYILWLAIGKVGHGFEVNDLVMIAGFITGFYWQFFNLFFRIRDIAKSLTDLEKYFGILENDTQVKDPEKPEIIKNPKGRIEFKNVGFVYPKNQEKILDGISLEIEEGQQVAFVGRSGAGKTTLTKLLLRFYDPSEGKILVDGKDIRKMRKSDLRSIIGIVPQEPIMFNNTIKFNLAYGRDKASTEEIRNAARSANILEFIEKLPKGWETQVGERGIKLSGGQKQR
ncbi:MAG TPA: ABC transporter ATP-binding protein, partial [Patescibacteria group bacterium]